MLYCLFMLFLSLFFSDFPLFTHPLRCPLMSSASISHFPHFPHLSNFSLLSSPLHILLLFFLSSLIFVALLLFPSLHYFLLHFLPLLLFFSILHRCFFFFFLSLCLFLYSSYCSFLFLFFFLLPSFYSSSSSPTLILPINGKTPKPRLRCLQTFAPILFLREKSTSFIEVFMKFFPHGGQKSRQGSSIDVEDRFPFKADRMTG